MSNEIRAEDVRRIAAQKEREVYGEERRFAEPHFGSARPRATDNPYVRSQAPRGPYDQDEYDAPGDLLDLPREAPRAPAGREAYRLEDAVDDGDLSLPPNYAGVGYATEAAYEEPPRRSRRLPLLLALAALLAAAAVLYFAYGQVDSEGPVSGEAPVIQSQAGEEKVKPAEEGGIEVPNQQATVLNPTASTQRTEVLMPPPEEPVAPPAPPAPALPAAATGGGTATTAAAPPPAEEDKLAALLLATTTGSVGTPLATQLQPAPTATQPVAGETANTQTALAPQPITPEAITPQAIAPQAVTALAPQPAATIGASEFLIQLASLTSTDAAQQTWSRLQQKHPDLLSDMALRVQEADIEGKGKYYRVQAGPLPNRATADDLCALLKSQQQDCIVVKR